jgi:hypothetical protein
MSKWKILWYNFRKEEKKNLYLFDNIIIRSISAEWEREFCEKTLTKMKDLISNTTTVTTKSMPKQMCYKDVVVVGE